MKFNVLLAALLLLVATLALPSAAAPGATVSPAAATPSTPASPDPSPPSSVVQPSRLRVLVCGDPPFVRQLPDGTFDGLSVDIWKAAATEIGARFTIIGKVATEDGVREVARGHADALVGPVGITAARARQVWFSVDYFAAAQAITSLPQHHGVLGFLRGYIAVGLIVSVAAFALLFIVGLVIWLLERRGNPDDFPASLQHGLATGMWLAVVTITTVGYGDHVPQTRAGRIFTAFWMLAAMLFASTLTASITSIFNEYRSQEVDMSRPAALAGRRLASVAGSTSANFARQWSTDVLDARNIDQAMGLLLSHRVEAVVFHEPETLYWIHEHPQVPLEVAAYRAALSEYGFAFPPRSPLVAEINVALLHLQESGEIERIRERNLAKALPAQQE